MKLNFSFKKALPHIVISAIFLVLSIVLFYPALQGYVLDTHDINQFKGGAQEIVDHRATYDEDPGWTNSMFGGMPADQISLDRSANKVRVLYKVYTLGLPRPISYMWAMFIGFYILLSCMKIEPRIAALGALGYGLTSFFFISLQAGHMTKVTAITCIAPAMGGFVLIFRKQWLKGGILTAFFMSLLIAYNHPQVFYYAFFPIGGICLFYGARMIMEKDYKDFGIAAGLAGLAVVFALGTGMNSLLPSYELSKETIRGKSDRTIKSPVEKQKELQELIQGREKDTAFVNKARKSITNYKQSQSGLSLDYALAWSYGTGETFTFMFPNLKGGGNNSIPANTKTLATLYPSQYEAFDEKVSEAFNKLKRAIYSYPGLKDDPGLQQHAGGILGLGNMGKEARGYYGNQGLTNGPVFIGSILCFLCFIALVISDGKFNYYLLGTAVLTIGFAYGQNVPLTLIGLLAMLVLSILNKKLIWMLFTITLTTVFLGWGKNYIGFSEFFFQYFPMYNKFRAVTMILILAELLIPLIGIIALVQIINQKEKIKANMKPLLIGAGVFGGFVFLVMANPEMLFSIPGKEMTNGILPQVEGSPFFEEIKMFLGVYDSSLSDLRVSVIRQDALLALLYSGLSFLVLFFFLKDKVTKNVMIPILSVLVLVEMLNTDLFYLNNSKDGDYTYWVEAKEGSIPFEVTPADIDVLKKELAGNPELQKTINDELKKRQANSDDVMDKRDKMLAQLSILNQNTNYRVYSRLEGVFSSTRTSAFHKSIGGYHGAKLMRYQELFEFYLQMGNQTQKNGILDMLNAKYTLAQATKTNPQTGEQTKVLVADERQGALGPAWIVSEVNFVDSTNQEILAVDPSRGFNPATTAVVRNEFKDLVGEVSPKSPSASIEMTQYKPNELKYQFNSDKDELVIFSEVYFKLGWKAFIDGAEVDHLRANYVLRGLKVPAGNHEIVFKYERSSVPTGNTISIIFSILLIIAMIYLAYVSFFKPTNEDETVDSFEVI